MDYTLSFVALLGNFTLPLLPVGSEIESCYVVFFSLVCAGVSFPLFWFVQL
jgi:hypothetical protein